MVPYPQPPFTNTQMRTARIGLSNYWREETKIFQARSYMGKCKDFMTVLDNSMKNIPVQIRAYIYLVMANN